MVRAAGRLRIAMVAREFLGISKYSGVSDVVHDLSRALLRKGHKVSVIMPLPAHTPISNNELKPVSIPFSGESIDVRVYQARFGSDVLPDFYFLNMPKVKLVSPQYADNKPLVDKHLGVFFDRAAVALLERIGGEIDVAHAHTKCDFFSYFAKTGGMKTPIVYTLHSLEGGQNVRFSKKEFERLTGTAYLAEGEVDPYVFAMNWSDKIVTVSEKYAEELREGTTTHVEYLAALQENAGKLSGILNGLDHEFTTEHLFAEGKIPYKFGPGDLSGKLLSRIWLQKALGFPVNPDIPILLWSQRLVKNKGIEELSVVVNKAMKMEMQIVILGRGSEDTERVFELYQGKLRDKLRFLRFGAHNAEYEPSFIAGSDVVLMPSLEEPCGLLAYKAMRLGTLPLVNHVGGLRQIVQDEGNGFVIPKEGPSLRERFGRKFDQVYFWRTEERAEWQKMQRRAMQNVPTWEEPAEKYAQIYRELVGQR